MKMPELIWLNGEVLPMSEARIGVEDRGFQFADGVYEVIRFYNGRPFTLRPHLERLERSAEGIVLKSPLARESLEAEIRKFIARASFKEGMIYLQLTRGAAPRNHIYSQLQTATLLFYARPLPPLPEPGDGEGVKLLVVPDDRWHRCWIKSIALLPNVLAKNLAASQGYDEAAFVDNGVLTECAASNLFAVVGKKLVTHPAGSRVLPGITRQVLFECAADLNIEIDERPIKEEEAQRSDELFITSTTREISWVARLNERYIGKARCGPMTIALHRALQARVRAEAY